MMGRHEAAYFLEQFMKVRAEAVKYLRQCPDGATSKQIAKAIGSTQAAVDYTLRSLHGVYVDRHIPVQSIKPRRGHPGIYNWAAVYMLVDIPESAQRPIENPTHEDWVRYQKSACPEKNNQ